MSQHFIPFMAEYSIIRLSTTFCLSAHLSMNIRVFPLLATVKMQLWTWMSNTCVSPCFQVFVDTSRNGTGLNGNLVTHVFKELPRRLPAATCTMLHSYRQGTKVLISPHRCSCLLCSVFLITVILMGTRWNLTVVFPWHPHLPSHNNRGMEASYKNNFQEAFFRTEYGLSSGLGGFFFF